MSIFNETECADVNGECRFVNEMNINHFLSITGVLIVVYILVMVISYCKLSSSISHYNKLPRRNIDIGRTRLSKV